MAGQIEAVRQDIAQTRAHLGATAEELRDTLAERATRAEEAIDPRAYARRYPWPTLAIAIAAGVALGASGADRAAKNAVVTGAQRAGESIGDAAVAAKDAVAEHVHSSDEPETAAPANDVERPIAWGYSGIRGKLAGALDDLLRQGLNEILTNLGVQKRIS